MAQHEMFDSSRVVTEEHDFQIEIDRNDIIIEELNEEVKQHKKTITELEDIITKFKKFYTGWEKFKHHLGL